MNAQLADPNAAGVAFGHIHLNVVDLEVQRRIWVDHFGGTWVDRDPVAAVWLPGTLVMFNEQAPTGGTEGSALDHIGFTVPDRDSFVAAWEADGFEVQQLFTSGEGVDQAYILTPEGVRIELFEDPDVSMPASTHHVHWSAADPAALLENYTRQYGLRARARGANPLTADVPGMNLSFAGVDAARPTTRGRAVDHIGFEVDDLAALVEALESDGVVLDIPYRTLEGLDLAIAFYTDAAGVVVELTEGLSAYR